jgi:hypothetical protein
MGLPLIQLGEPVEGLVDRDDVESLVLEIVHHQIKRHAPPAPAAPVGRPSPRMVDQDLPHGPRSRREQISAVRRVLENRVSYQADHSLVDHGGWGESMVESLAPHESGGDVTQLLIDQADELTPGPLVAVTGSTKHECQIALQPGTHVTSAEQFNEGFYRHYPQEFLKGQGVKVAVNPAGAGRVAHRGLGPWKVLKPRALSRGCRKRRTMLDLVVWSFVLVLTPVALGFAFKVIVGVGELFERGQSLTRKVARN